MDKNDHILLSRLEDELKKIVRRMETMQKSLDILYEDRGILEDLQSQFRALQEKLHLVSGDQERRSKDLSHEIQGVSEKMEQKVGEVGDSVEKNIGALVSEVKQKEVITVREGFLKRIMRILKK